MAVRIVLDTGPVRNVIEGDPRQIDLEALRRARPSVRTSIAGPALAELAEQLIDGAIRLPLWIANVGQYDGVLDDEWPFLPSGRQLTAFTGVAQTGTDINLAEESRLLQTWWRLFRQLRSTADLMAGLPFTFANGQQSVVAVDEPRLRQTIAETRNGWIGYVQSFSGRSGIDASRQAILNEIIRRHGQEDGDATDQQQRLMPVFNMIAILVESSLRSRTPYNPELRRRRGDTFDITLLYVLAHPEALIVTADGPFIERLRQTRLPDAARVLSIEELNERLQGGTLDEV
jgi:hypothetical protein